MGFLDDLLNRSKNSHLPELEGIADDDIVAMADGQMIDVKTLPDPMFAEEMLGKSVAFRYPEKKVVLCSPANGNLATLFPTGHAFGVKMKNDTELIVHCGIDTVNSRGDGFRLLKKQGDEVKAGEGVVEVDIGKLSGRYDMSTILIITSSPNREYDFIEDQSVVRGQKLIK